MFEVLKFEKNLVKTRKKAQELFEKKQNTVVCKYCGNLLKKDEAGCIYDIEKKQLTFCHEECFEKNEYHGTIEDLRGGK